nr:hypothetical protein [Micromonospora sp. DSM 115978]
VVERATTGRAAEAASPESAVAALRELLVEAVDADTGTGAVDPRQAKSYQALRTAYFHRVPTQEAAAEQLRMSLSTFRRHLDRGLSRVCDRLWRLELGGAPFARV